MIRAMRAATPASCVTRTTVRPRSRRSSSSRSITSPPVLLSRLPVGSSPSRICGAIGERAGHRDALTLAARELLDREVGSMGEAHALEELAGAQAPLRAPHLEAHHRQLDVLDRRERRDQVVELEDEADLPARAGGRDRRPARSRCPRRRAFPRSGDRARRAGSGASSCPSRDGPTTATVSPRPTSKVDAVERATLPSSNERTRSRA